MLQYFLIFMAVYLLYQFIFKLVLPIYRQTKHIRNQFKQASEQMQDQMNGTRGNGEPDSTSPIKKPNKADYIDFEEVK